MCEFVGSLLIICCRIVPFEDVTTKSYFVTIATILSTTIFVCISYVWSSLFSLREYIRSRAKISLFKLRLHFLLLSEFLTSEYIQTVEFKSRFRKFSKFFDVESVML